MLVLIEKLRLASNRELQVVIIGLRRWIDEHRKGELLWSHEKDARIVGDRKIWPSRVHHEVAGLQEPIAIRSLHQRAAVFDSRRLHPLQLDGKQKLLRVLQVDTDRKIHRAAGRYLEKPIIILLTAAPISVAGWGVGEALFVKIFGQLGVEPFRSAALSILYRLTGLIWSLPGLVFYLLIKGRDKSEKIREAIKGEEQELEEMAEELHRTEEAQDEL